MVETTLDAHKLAAGEVGSLAEQQFWGVLGMPHCSQPQPRGVCTGVETGLYNLRGQMQTCINPKGTAWLWAGSRDPGCYLRVDATTQGLGGPCVPSKWFVAGDERPGMQL